MSNKEFYFYKSRDSTPKSPLSRDPAPKSPLSRDSTPKSPPKVKTFSGVDDVFLFCSHCTTIDNLDNAQWDWVLYFNFS